MCYILNLLSSPKFKREENDVKHTSELIRHSSESDLFQWMWSSLWMNHAEWLIYNSAHWLIDKEIREK